MFNWGALEAYLRLYVLTKLQCALSDVLSITRMEAPQARVSFKANLITNVKRRVTRTASGGANGTLRREIQHNPKQDSAPGGEFLGSGKGGLRKSGNRRSVAGNRRSVAGNRRSMAGQRQASGGSGGGGLHLPGMGGAGGELDLSRFPVVERLLQLNPQITPAMKRTSIGTHKRVAVRESAQESV
jgi:hypothetical protein